VSDGGRGGAALQACFGWVRRTMDAGYGERHKSGGGHAAWTARSVACRRVRARCDRSSTMTQASWRLRYLW